MKQSLTGLLSMSGLLLASAVLLSADPVTGTLYFTTYSGGANVNKVSASYDGTTFTMGSIVNVASTPGADGILFASDGDLLIGGQGNRVHKVNPATGTFTSKTPDVGAFHLALDPSGDFFYAAGIPSGGVSTVPLNPFADGTHHTVTGDDPFITSIAFAGSQAFYTNAGPGGSGSFGRLDTTTFTTTRLITGLNSAHGMTYDPFTGHLITFSGSHISQIDTAGNIVSERTVPGMNFDQGAADGRGHVFIASNTGNLFFLDYKGSGLVGDAANFSAQPFLAGSLDDIAPLVGPGAPPSDVPEPSTVFSMVGGLGVLLLVRRLHQRAC